MIALSAFWTSASEVTSNYCPDSSCPSISEVVGILFVDGTPLSAKLPSELNSAKLPCVNVVGFTTRSDAQE